MKRKKVKVLGLSHSQSQAGSYIAVLSEKGGRKIPVIIKPAEAQNIALKMEGIKTARPLTHDLIKSMTEAFSIEVQEVYIYKVVEGIFYTKIICSNGIEESETECTVGDGIAISMTYGCPIWASMDVIESAGIKMSEGEAMAEDAAEEDDEEEIAEEPKKKMSIEDLDKMMKNAIANEEYEIAAELRDRITKLKGEA